MWLLSTIKKSSIKKVLRNIVFSCILTVIVLSPVFATEYSSTSDNSSEFKMLEPGEEAPDFEILTLEDDDFKLSDIIGKKIIFLFFWSIFCQPCQEEIPVVKELYEKVGKDNLVVLAVSLDGEKRVPAIKKYIKKNNLDFVFLMDIFDDDASSFIASDSYGVLGTPTFFIIDKQGIVTHNHTGKSTLDELMKNIADAKPGS